jgi:hypothetical protein
MRILIAFLLLVAGGVLLAQFYLPEAPRLPPNLRLPAPWAWYQVPLGALFIVSGLALWLFSGRRPVGQDDAPLVKTLAGHGFQVTPCEGGWQAVGTWGRTPLVVRKTIGREASRFGRSWVIVVSMEGQPIEPWPFLPEQGSLVELRPDGFSVSLPDMYKADRQAALAQRLDALIASRRTR